VTSPSLNHIKPRRRRRSRNLNKQIETINGGWKGTEQQIATQAQIAANLVGAAGGAAPAEGAAANTINDKAQLLSQKVLEAQAAFNEADSRLDNAIKHYGDAASAAQKLASEVNTKRQGVERNSPYYKAFDDLMATVNPAIYKLGQAEAQQLRATAHASQAISLIGQQRMMQTLQPILADAKLEMPQALTGLQVDAELEAHEELGRRDVRRGAQAVRGGFDLRAGRLDEAGGVGRPDLRELRQGAPRPRHG
jgi:hypothetical protein